MQSDEIYLTVLEAAEIEDYSLQHVQRLCRKGAFDAMKVKGRWSIPFSGLHPIIKKAKYPHLKSEAYELLAEFSLVHVSRGLVSVSMLDVYEDEVSRSIAMGIETERAMSQACDTLPFGISEVRRRNDIYTKKGLRGLLEYYEGLFRRFAYEIKTPGIKTVDCRFDSIWEKSEYSYVEQQFMPWTVKSFVEYLVYYLDTDVNSLRKNIEENIACYAEISEKPNRRPDAVFKTRRAENIARIE